MLIMNMLLNNWKKKMANKAMGKLMGIKDPDSGSQNPIARSAEQSRALDTLNEGLVESAEQDMPENKNKKRQTSGITTEARIRYNQAMKKEARDNIDNPDYVQPSPEEWVKKYYPKGYLGQ